MSAALPPYAALLGIHEQLHDGEALLAMPFAETLNGRPGFLHGGAIAGLLEMALIQAGTAALAEAGREGAIKPVGMTFTFLRGGKHGMTYASAQVERMGKRIVNVDAYAWQDDRHAPIASAACNFIIR